MTQSTPITATWKDATSKEFDKKYAAPISEKLAALEEALRQLSQTLENINKQLSSL